MPQCRSHTLISVVLGAVLAFGMLIVPEAHGAVVPYSIEQMMTQPSTSAYGAAVSLSGDTAVVGQTSNGASTLFVYVRSGDTWALQHPIPSPGAAADWFGAAVAVDGNTMIVGAPTDDVAGANAGRAYVYTRSGTSWTKQGEFAGETADDRFGTSVAVSGDVALVGAPMRNIGVDADQGAVYVFRRTAGVWAQSQVLTIPEGVAGDEFGMAVDIDGTTLAAAAPYADSEVPTPDAGRVYVFTDEPTGWLQQGGSIQPTTFNWANWGTQVSVSGNTLLIGVQNGVPRVYTRSGGVWTHQQALVPSSLNAADHLGAAVDLYGDTAVVGSWGLTVGGRLNNGGAFVFTRSGTTWTETTALTASDGAAQDHFGQAVATNGTCALVGAPFENGAVGKAYFYSTPAPPPQPVVLLPVYRFYNRTNGTHFYTDSASERDMVNATWPHIFTDEGPCYYLNPANNTTPLTRLYNKQVGSHFYTSSTSEAANAVDTWPNIFRWDGPTYAVNPGAVPGSLPVYRFYNMRNGSHFYTASEDEKNHVLATWPTIYALEGPAFWIGQ